ncbi:MAG: hypothetical protein WCL29_06670 [Pseudomonadota bacterium]
MTNIHRGLCWAAAMLMVAIAKKYGVFNAEAADTVLLVLPIAAVLSFRNKRKCNLLRKAEA